MTQLDLAPDHGGLGKTRWNTFASGDTLTAAQFVDALAPLLQATVTATDAPDPALLIEQLAGTLSLDERETSLRIPAAAEAAGTREIADQAVAIGRGVAQLAGRSLERVLADPIPLPAGPLEIRSHCDNHLWTHPVTDLLTGPSGGPVPMQLYNEWLHQVVLLRDALLPFSNWEEVPLPVDPTGLRAVEPARDAFLTELLVRSTRHAAIVAFARSVLTGGTGARAYGFDYAGGRVLPTVVGAGIVATPTRLLTWHPPGESSNLETIDLVPARADYHDAPRSPLDTVTEATTSPALRDVTAALVDGPAAGGTRTLSIAVRHGDHHTEVDLGDALRGHRFAYAAGSSDTERPAPAGADGAPRPVAAWPVLSAPHQVWTEQGTWSVDASGADDLVQLALLGKLFPENVVVATGRAAGDATATGKRGPARIILDV